MTACLGAVLASQTVQAATSSTTCKAFGEYDSHLKSVLAQVNSEPEQETETTLAQVSTQGAVTLPNGPNLGQ
jgi:hypothetical protein